MKKIILAIAMLLLLTPAFTALASGTQQDWLNAKAASQTAQAAYNQAQLDYAADKTPDNEKRVVATAKTVLNSALDEAQAWLEWKDQEAQANSEVPADIKANISADVSKNLAKISGLRADVASITDRAGVLLVFLKMIGSYGELLTDVARNTGSEWIYLGNNRIATAESYEAKLRTTALKLDNNSEIISKLDLAKSEIDLAKTKVGLAEADYKLVKLPGTPLIKFAEGNNYLNQARTNLLNATARLVAAFNLITSK